MFEIIQDLLWEFLYGESGIVQAIFYIFNKTNILLILNVDSLFQEFDIDFSTIQNTIYFFAFYLIILKFVKKILDVYALQTDGDANGDVMVLITNFCKAMVIAMSFTTIWSWILDIAYDFGIQILDSIQWFNKGMASSTGNSFYDFSLTMREVGEGAGRGNAAFVIIIVFTLLSFILMIMQIKNGIELWFLRLGVPLACCGLLDADQGVFKQYTKIFLKGILTILTQLILLNIGCFLMVVALKHVPGNRYDLEWLESGKTIILGIYACAAVIAAFAMPKLLSEFLVPKQGGGGKVMQAVYMGSFLLRGVM